MIIQNLYNILWYNNIFGYDSNNISWCYTGDLVILFHETPAIAHDIMQILLIAHDYLSKIQE